MKTRIKIHETKWGPPRVHRMNWKARFGVLTSWRPKKTKNERWMSKNGWKPSRNYSRKRYKNVTEAPRLGFSSRKQFSSANLREYEVPRRLSPLTPPPIYSKIGEELATQLAQASKVTSSRSNSLLEEATLLAWASGVVSSSPILL